MSELDDVIGFAWSQGFKGSTVSEAEREVAQLRDNRELLKQLNASVKLVIKYLKEKFRQRATVELAQLRFDLSQSIGETINAVGVIVQLRAALAAKDAEIAEMRRLIEDTRDLARTGLPIEGYTPEQWNDYRLIGIAGSLTTYLTYHPKEGQQ